jgi:hypothetical protein
MVTADLKTRVLEAARAAPSPTRQDRVAGARVILVVSPAVAVALLLAFDGLHHGQGRPRWFFLAATAGWAIVALAATWVALARHRLAAAFPREWLVGVALGTPVVLFGMMLGFALAFPELTTLHAERVGFRCLGLALATAAFPFAALTRLRRGSDPVHPVASGAAIGVACGAWAGVVVELWCPVAAMRHVLVGHVLPMVVLGALGAMFASRVIAMSAPATSRG